jgi:hypothetical protein
MPQTRYQVIDDEKNYSTLAFEETRYGALDENLTAASSTV